LKEHLHIKNQPSLLVPNMSPLAETYGHSGLAETNDKKSCFAFLYLLTVKWNFIYGKWNKLCAVEKLLASRPDCSCLYGCKVW